jgi:hypothetical protein
MPEGGNTIVVKINNLCPVEGNPLCAAPVGEFESIHCNPIRENIAPAQEFGVTMGVLADYCLL